MTHWVIVGGGTAGCVVAARLSESDGDHVTVVEAGPDRQPQTVSYLDDLDRPGALWDGLVASDGGTQQRRYPQGRGLGGSSAVSGGVLSGSEDDTLRSEVLVAGETPRRDELGVVDRALLAAADDATIAMLGRRDGSRRSTADDYLGAARHRRNVDVVTDAAVDRVDLVGRTARGVVLADGSTIAADRVVCAAGALFTPALLLRSDIDTPGVGEGLRDHVGRVIDVTVHHETGDGHGLVTGAVLRRGVIEFVAMNHLGPALPGRAALLVGLLGNQRRGTVRPCEGAPDDPTASPLVDFGRLGDADAVRLAAGVQMAEALLATPPFADLVDDADVVDGFGGYAHPTSTCAMGTVVDEHGAVRGYDNLFVTDASALADLPPSGTYLPVVLLAERLAHGLRGF